MGFTCSTCRNKAIDADQAARRLKPCRSPYCECSQGQCTHPGFYDARHEPSPVPAPPATPDNRDPSAEWNGA
jgi:hypothetical protein